MKTRYAEQPKTAEIVQAGDRKAVFVRRNITQVEEEWECDEYVSTVADTPFLALTPALEQAVIDKATEYEARKVRARRNALLDASDKSMMPDRGMSSDEVEAWQDYRRALRDIPNQAGFPFDVAWPDIP